MITIEHSIFDYNSIPKIVFAEYRIRYSTDILEYSDIIIILNFW